MAIDHGFMEKLTALCKRRGFIYQSSEIYGGIGGFWDYGPLGVELKRNIKDLWWHDMVTNPPIGPDGRQVEMVGLDCSIIMNPKVWEASGHTTGFADPMVDCRESKQRYRADQLMVIDPAPAGHQPGSESAWNRLFAFVDDDPASYEGALRKAKHFARKLGVALPEPPPVLPLLRVLEKVEQLADIVGPHAENPGTLTEPRQFNLMFKTYVGALEDAASVAYLRPETAQGIFANFKNVLDTTRVKIPFGIAQIGKSFRNEINPRNYTFRSREFEQMEIEFFCRGTEAGRQAGAPGEVTDMDWYAFWRKVRYDWYVNLGLKSEKLRLRDQGPDELAHYSRACADIEYLFPFSDDFQELEGVAHRGNFDLTQHQKFSGKDLTYFDADAWERDKAARAALSRSQASASK